MKIAVHGVDFSSTTGPNAFCRRMLAALSDRGHTIVSPGQRCDVDFANIALVARPASRVIVQRLDGIWTAPAQVHMNAEIYQTFKLATRVIWQSAYDKRVVCAAFGEKLGHIIKNGALKPSHLALAQAAEIKQKIPGKIACCSAAWHPQKRLRENICMMREIATMTSQRFTMLVLGTPDITVAAPDVIVIGKASEQLCQAVYAASDVMIHLSWRDHCPNAVVEALAAGTPVICASSGGTHELACPHVHVTQDVNDACVHPVMFDHDLPPALQVKATHFALDRCACDVHTIERAAKEYEEALLSAVNSGA